MLGDDLPLDVVEIKRDVVRYPHDDKEPPEAGRGLKTEGIGKEVGGFLPGPGTRRGCD